MSLLEIVLLALAGVLALRLFWHRRQLGAFRSWLRDPRLDTLPGGAGVWEDTFAELHRHIKRRETMHEQLQRSLARFRAASQALPDGVVILDRENRIEWANLTAAHELGIDALRDAGQPLTNLIRHPDFVAYLEGGRYAEPFTLRRGEGALSVRLIQFGEDQKLLSSRDVTADERLERMRREFIANVSHELKTPVTVLGGFVETLAEPSLELTESQRRRYLELMAEQAQRMHRLIEDLLTLSQLESGMAPPDEAPIEIGPLLDRLVEEAHVLSGGRHRIEHTLEADSRLLGSPRELTSAFSNLVSNAVRYTPQGGSVRLAWRIEAGRGVFSVSDSGIGIEARHLPRLTERFYRVDSSRSRETGGTGLGLAIVKRSLARHQAILDVESELGRGSTFRAVFPASRLLARGKARAAA